MRRLRVLLPPLLLLAGCAAPSLPPGEAPVPAASSPTAAAPGAGELLPPGAPTGTSTSDPKTFMD